MFTQCVLGLIPNTAEAGHGVAYLESQHWEAEAGRARVQGHLQ